MKNKNNILLIIGLYILTITFGCKSPQLTKSTEADVIIYGGTAAAVVAAVQLRKLNKSVVIVSPDSHLGGLSAGGLGFTDTGNKQVIGGLAREFYQRVYNHYQRDSSWTWQAKDEYGNKGQGSPAIDGENRTMWIFEPHVAEQIFEDFIKEHDIRVDRDHWLDRENGIEVKNGKISSIRMLNGKIYKAQIFIDATYEGDLMAAAGVSFHVGREANSTYEEQWNGVQKDHKVAYRFLNESRQHFPVREIDPYIVPGDPSSGVIPRVSTEPPGENGNGDKKIQAFCFRLCLTDVKENQVPFARPENYDPWQFELLGRLFEAGWGKLELIHNRSTRIMKFDPIPNRKTDTNNHGPFSTDNIGMNYDYPEASYERRREIIKEHEGYQKGLFYFYLTDPRVPEEVRKEMSRWGLSKDEFTDNGHWPHQIYVREARRMVGAFVMTENEIIKVSPVPRSVGMGSYTLDSHHAQRYITADGFVENEGNVNAQTNGPYQIDMWSLLPKPEECANLLVPVALSSSHIAFGSMRMEPVFMILGQSAGIMASMAIDENKHMYELDYREIRPRLEEEGQVLNYSKQ
jgi:hypothetical protein